MGTLKLTQSKSMCITALSSQAARCTQDCMRWSCRCPAAWHCLCSRVPDQAHLSTRWRKTPAQQPMLHAKRQTCVQRAPCMRLLPMHETVAPSQSCYPAEPCPISTQQRGALRLCLSLGLIATPSMQVSLLTGILFMLGAVCRLGSVTKLLTPPIISRWALACQLHKEWTLRSGSCCSSGGNWRLCKVWASARHCCSFHCQLPHELSALCQ